MPITLTAGISRKMGLPNYGSLGATCHVEVELDGSPNEAGREAFQQDVRGVFAACAQAVEEELARQSQISRPAPERAEPTADANGANGSNGNGSNGNGTTKGLLPIGNGHRATARQIDFAGSIASQIRGLGIRRLESVCQHLLGKPLLELSSAEASRLIDTLKAVRDGQIELASILEGVDS